MNKINISYNRKSSEDKEKQIQSIDAQLDENRQTAKYMSESIDLEVVEEKSAKTPYQRNEFSRIVQMMYEHKVKYIFCWKLNRLARNMIEGGILIDLLQNKYIDAIVTPNKIYYPADNVLVMSFEFGQANQFSIDLSNDVKRGQKNKIEKGLYPGLAPTGYINEIYAEKGTKKILPDPERFNLVRIFFDEVLKGSKNFNELAVYAHKIGLTPLRGKKFAKSTVIRMITNIFYYGEFKWKGEIYQGTHKPIISREEFERIQYTYNLDNRPIYRSHDHNEYNGILKCGYCGFAITPEPLKFKKIKSTGETRSYKYWRCTRKSKDVKCLQKSIREEDLKTLLDKFLNTVEMGDEFVEWGAKYLDYIVETERVQRSVIAQNLNKQLTDTSQSLDRLTKLYISPQNIDQSLFTQEDFINQKNDLQNKKNELITSIQKLSKRQDEVADSLVENMRFTIELVNNFNEGTPDYKREVFKKLARTVTFRDGKLSIEPVSNYGEVLKVKSLVDENLDWLELNPTNKDKDIEKFLKIKTVWSERRESNPHLQFGKLT